MAWNKKRRLFGKNAYYSISKKLRKESKSSEEFELMLNGLSLEDVIALKLEIATRIQDLDERLKSIQNSWYRADENSKEHKELYSETLDKVIRLAAFASELGADLHVYVLDKVQKWEKEDASE